MPPVHGVSRRIPKGGQRVLDSQLLPFLRHPFTAFVKSTEAWASRRLHHCGCTYVMGLFRPWYAVPMSVRNMNVTSLPSMWQFCTLLSAK
jgi:hypothetical protein